MDWSVSIPTCLCFSPTSIWMENSLALEQLQVGYVEIQWNTERRFIAVTQNEIFLLTEHWFLSHSIILQEPANGLRTLGAADSDNPKQRFRGLCQILLNKPFDFDKIKCSKKEKKTKKPKETKKQGGRKETKVGEEGIAPKKIISPSNTTFAEAVDEWINSTCVKDMLSRTEFIRRSLG